MLTTVYQLKVSLLRTKPPIWRRLLVNADMTLNDLHSAIQSSFGWDDCHLHMFEVDQEQYGTPSEDAWFDIEDDALISIGEVLKRPGDSLAYEYDFGDSWKHAITLEKVVPEPGFPLPACTGGRRACPPEDCGGPWGYANLLHILQNPDHPEYEDWSDWLEDFDPAAFDVKAANAALAWLSGKQ